MTCLIFPHTHKQQLANSWKVSKTVFTLRWLIYKEDLTIWIKIIKYESKKGGKDQELTQSSATPDPGHDMGEWQKHN